MRVFLLQPCTSHEASKGFKVPLGLAYLAAYLKREGHDVAAMDMNYPLDSPPRRYLREDSEVIETVQAFNPDVIGFSCYTHTRHNAYFWAEVLKRHIPGVTTVFGGPHVSFLPEQILNRHPEVDYIIRFEGEIPFASFLRELENGTNMDGVPSLAYRDAKGHPTVTERMGFIKDLDSLPDPDISVFYHADELMMQAKPVEGRSDLFQGPMLHIMTSRGCPFGCKFCCSSHFWGKGVRFHSPERVIEQIKMIRERWPTVRNVAFHDDTLTLKRSHVQRICELLLAENLKFRWTSWSRLDVLDADLLRLMKEAGCVYLKCGIESGTERGLKLVGKKIRLAEVPEKVQMIKDSGIVGAFSFILGIPGETTEEAYETIRMIRRLGVTRENLRVNFWTLIHPGTYFCREFEKKHGQIDWDEPDSSILRFFTRDSLGNPIMPYVAFDHKVVKQLKAAVHIPLPHEGLERQDRQSAIKELRAGSFYLYRQFISMENVLRTISSEVSRVLCLHVTSDESVLRIPLEETGFEITELAASSLLSHQAGEKSALDELKNASCDLVIDLNSMPEIPQERWTSVIDQLGRVLVDEGYAIFFWRNSQHLLSRVRQRLGLAGYVKQQAYSIAADDCVRLLQSRGFSVIRRRGEGIEIPWLSRRFPALWRFLREQVSWAPISFWNLILCKKTTQKEAPVLPLTR